MGRQILQQLATAAVLLLGCGALAAFAQNAASSNTLNAVQNISPGIVLTAAQNSTQNPTQSGLTPPSDPSRDVKNSNKSAAASHTNPVRLASTSPAQAAAKADAASKLANATQPALATKPDWAELSPAQQTALKPLGANWAGLTASHKRKWISLAQNYPKMATADQGKLHARMTEWAALSPKQREHARLNFAQTQELTKALSPEERKAKWQAYQALSPEEKQKLATSAPPKPTGAAVAAKPVAPQKMATTPIGQDANPNAPRISVAPHLLGQNSLMPLQSNPKP